MLTILQLQLHLRVQVGKSPAVYNIIKMSCYKIRAATASCRVQQKLPQSIEYSGRNYFYQIFKLSSEQSTWSNYAVSKKSTKVVVA